MGAVLAALVRGGLPPRWSFWFDLREGERHGVRVAEFGERVDPGTAGIAEAEQLGDLVEGLAGGVVDGAADERVAPGAVRGAREIEVGVAAGDDQRQRRLRGLERSGRAVPGASASAVEPKRPRGLALRSFSSTAWMWPSRWLTAMSGRLLREGQSLGVGDADQQRSGEAGTGGDGDGVEIGEGDAAPRRARRGPRERWRGDARGWPAPEPRRRSGRGWRSARRRRRKACARRARRWPRRSRRRRFQCRG